ncbi:hypothetical protein AVEN_250993-1 [Araneus ventricosus]|uniref:DUF7041 domain-containing protein n=1 Tax=Araneus ventricosus TaxID=182803 RepID=A0A4Y2P1R9_ARAVE|nr:hypothetical protein AVEN_250993-1 [Araneus ventricosus]
MEENSAVKMPPFNFGDPQLWFIMAEATFQLAIPKPITASATKYNYCVAHLSPEAAAIVRDVITSGSPCKNWICAWTFNGWSQMVVLERLELIGKGEGCNS